MGLASARRILALMRRRDRDSTRTSAAIVRQITGDIVFDHVTFGYGGDPILEGHLVPRQAR